MAPPKWAYRTENFDPKPDEELVCSICQNLFCDPVQCPCGHVYCKDCITEWLTKNRKCPVCRGRISRSSIQQAVPLIKNMIMKLTLKCRHAPNGCEEKVSLERLEFHLKECNYKLVQCSKYCKEKVFKKDLADHEANCNKDNYMTCNTCEMNIPISSKDTHNCLNDLKEKLQSTQNALQKFTQKIQKLKAKNKYLSGRLSERMPNYYDSPNSTSSSFLEDMLADDSHDSEDGDNGNSMNGEHERVFQRTLALLDEHMGESRSNFESDPEWFPPFDDLSDISSPASSNSDDNSLSGNSIFSNDFSSGSDALLRYSPDDDASLSNSNISFSDDNSEEDPDWQPEERMLL